MLTVGPSPTRLRYSLRRATSPRNAGRGKKKQRPVNFLFPPAGRLRHDYRAADAIFLHQAGAAFAPGIRAEANAVRLNDDARPRPCRRTVGRAGAGLRLRRRGRHQRCEDGEHGKKNRAKNRFDRQIHINATATPCGDGSGSTGWCSAAAAAQAPAHNGRDSSNWNKTPWCAARCSRKTRQTPARRCQRTELRQPPKVPVSSP